MTDFKANASLNLTDFIEKYEPPIQQLLSNLEIESSIIKSFDQDEIDKIKRFIRISNASLALVNNVDRLIKFDLDKWDSVKQELIYKGYTLKNDGEQMGVIYCHAYQVFAERLKLHLVTTVDSAS
jgi:hypothetical protein